MRTRNRHTLKPVETTSGDQFKRCQLPAIPGRSSATHTTKVRTPDVGFTEKENAATKMATSLIYDVGLLFLTISTV